MLKKILRSKRGEGYLDVCILVLCAMLVIALAVLCTNLLLDLVYGMVDPRVRYEGI